MTTKDVTQVCYKDSVTGRPSVSSRVWLFSADAREGQTKIAKNIIPRHVGFIPDGNRR